MARVHTPRETEVALFHASRRRCCVCTALEADYSVKEGQIAHLNRSSADSRLENLVWLCLRHHDLFDGRTSQSKGLTESEVRHYRSLLYRHMEEFGRTGPSEAAFLSSYLRVVSDEARVTDTHSDLLTRNLEQIRKEVRGLVEQSDWTTIVELRSRIREYFEYSGDYQSGYEFGEIYAEALRRLKRPTEELWVRVKDVAYMRILDGKHTLGRRELERVIKEMSSSSDSATSTALAQLGFYANRYLGISYQRCTRPDVDEAEKHFCKSRELLADLPSESLACRHMAARITGNFGNLAQDRGRQQDALELYRQSLREFESLQDLEHVGIANLQIAKSLVSTRMLNRDAAAEHLAEALAAFSQIGWLEGLGRVHEQHAQLWLRLARNARRTDRRTESVNRARRQAEIAAGIFDRMRSARFRGRLDSLFEEIRLVSLND